MQAIHTRAHGELMYLLLVMGPLVYMVLCCQYSLLRLGFINVFSFRHHVVPHCTHSTSLLRNGAWACRFMAPICYNYLHVIRMQDYLASGEVWNAPFYMLSFVYLLRYPNLVSTCKLH